MTEGPATSLAKETHASKYRGEGESFREYAGRVAAALTDNETDYYNYRDILVNQRFLPGGRVQSSIGSPRRTTALNCYVAGTIEDSMDGIMEAAKEAASTMRKGGGIGYCFSTIRPKGDLITSFGTPASGPLSFMEIFNAVCKTVSSAGNRRGAQMGVLRVDHPDIEAFIEAKCNDSEFKQFNLSVAITDKFMQAVIDDDDFELVFKDKVYARVNACDLWEKIMRATWDWAEPGVLFIDRINEYNNLNYCETIAATNPCGEEPLPPYGACLLGSFNLVKYLLQDDEGTYTFDWQGFKGDIPLVVKSQDAVIDNTVFPLPKQELEARAKRRQGLGVTALANTGEALGFSYGSEEFIVWQEKLLSVLANSAYQASALLAEEKGPFPEYTPAFLNSKFVKGLSSETIALIQEHGVRNSHLISFAPTGTISICADNVSSGIEPVFSYGYARTILREGASIIEQVEDYGVKFLGVFGKTADQCSTDEHLAVLSTATKWSDSAVSKTINVGNDVHWEEFKDVYMKAWKLGCKGCTTFRAAGKRFGILNATDTACYINPTTGKKTCE